MRGKFQAGERRGEYSPWGADGHSLQVFSWGRRAALSPMQPPLQETQDLQCESKLSACFNQIHKEKYNFLAKCNKTESSHNMPLIMSRIHSKLLQIKAEKWGSFLRKTIIQTPRCPRCSNEQTRISKRLWGCCSRTERKHALHYNERKPHTEVLTVTLNSNDSKPYENSEHWKIKDLE